MKNEGCEDMEEKLNKKYLASLRLFRKVKKERDVKQ